MKGFFDKAIASIITTAFFGIFLLLFPSPKWFHYAFLLVVLLIAYFWMLPALIKFKEFLIRKKRLYFPKIGILNGSINGGTTEYACKRAWTEITPSVWQIKINESLRKVLFKTVKLINVSEIDDSFTIIINPFGDNFPEEDLEFHTTFHKIRRYMEMGGVFLNPGGAFFWNQNTAKSDQLVEFITRRFNGVQAINDSPLYLKFGVSTTADVIDTVNNIVRLQEPIDVEVYQQDNDKNIVGDLLVISNKVKRFRAVNKATGDFIPLLREKGDENFPIAAIRYGKGFLILAGIHLWAEESIEFRMITEAVKIMVVNGIRHLNN